MNLLSLDTCTDAGSLGLIFNGSPAAAEILPPGWRSNTLHSEINRLLKQHSITTAEIDAYAITSGPGSFTGVRVGLACVKAFAEIHGKPIVAVSTLKVISAAAQASCQTPAPTMFAAIMDARRGQVFGGMYVNDGGCLKLICAEEVCSLAAFLERIPQALKRSDGSIGNPVFCGVDLEPYAEKIQSAGWPQAELVQVPACIADTLCKVALVELERGRGIDSATAQANYIRQSDAEMFWKTQADV